MQPCPEPVRRLWAALSRLDDPMTRRVIRSALPRHDGVDARCLGSLISVLDGEQSAAVELVALAPQLSGPLDGPPAPWPLLLLHGLRRLPEPARGEVIAAVLPRLREEVADRTRAWVEDPRSVDLTRLRSVFENSVLEVNQAGAEAMAGVGAEPSVRVQQDAEALRIQAWIDEFNALQAQFASGHPRGAGVEARAKRLVEVERALNAHWLALPSRMWSELVAQGRFVSGGSAGVVAWLRNERRYEEAVAHVCAELADLTLCRLRQQTHARAFEAFFNNGMGSFLDSGNPAHIAQGVEILDRLESVLQPFVGRDALYQAACLRARAGQVDRALVCVQLAVHAGESLRHMAQDPDLASIVDTERFQAMLREA